MKKEIYNQASESNAEREKAPEQERLPAKESEGAEQEWWNAAKYSDSSSESDR